MYNYIYIYIYICICLYIPGPRQPLPGGGRCVGRPGLLGIRRSLRVHAAFVAPMYMCASTSTYVYNICV